MKKKDFFIIVFVFLVIAVVIVLSEPDYKKEALACFQDHCFDVELALNSEERNRGLMFREELGPDKGMLFVFKDEGEHPFWMKNVLIPLDIVWISKNNEVVFISENTQPCRESLCHNIKPNQNAKYVLEINGGVSEKINLREGDRITFIYK